MEDPKMVEMMQQLLAGYTQMANIMAQQETRSKEQTDLLGKLVQSMDKVGEKLDEIALYNKSTSQNTRETVKSIEKGNDYLRGMSVIIGKDGQKTIGNVSQAAYYDPSSYRHDGISNILPDDRKARGPQDNFDSPDLG